MPSTTFNGASATGTNNIGATSTGTNDAAGRAQAAALGIGRIYGLAAVLAAVGAGFVLGL